MRISDLSPGISRQRGESAGQPAGHTTGRRHDAGRGIGFSNAGQALFHKLQTDGDWNCRPQDLSNLTRWLSRTFEVPLRWEVVSFDMSLARWRVAPILYITGSKSPAFTEPQIARLRRFVLEGGTIFSCAQGEDFQKGIREAYLKMFPEYPLVELREDHPLRKGSSLKLWGITNGLRPLVVHCNQDLPNDWQLNKAGTARESFQFAARLAVYVTGKSATERWPKLAWPRPKQTDGGDAVWPEPVQGGPAKAGTVVRVKWKGNWNPEPLALERFTRLMSKQVGKKIVELPAADVANLGKSGATLAVLSGVGMLRLRTRGTGCAGGLRCQRRHIIGGRRRR